MEARPGSRGPAAERRDAQLTMLVGERRGAQKLPDPVDLGPLMDAVGRLEAIEAVKPETWDAERGQWSAAWMAARADVVEAGREVVGRVITQTAEAIARRR